jgi:hypothetical protein
VIRSKRLRKAIIGLVAAAVPAGMAVAGAAPASAGPGVCVGGPFGYAYACVDTPGWVDWYDGPRWRHGDWDDWQEDRWDDD